MAGIISAFKPEKVEDEKQILNNEKIRQIIQSLIETIDKLEKEVRDLKK